jgi:crotonobetainyl-CoA:carnitine CoA-transferase CaiB-like acyl-CoA transferase
MLKPFNGIRVIEASKTLSCAISGMLLKDNGAEVVKVCKPNEIFAALDRGKLVVTDSNENEIGQLIQHSDVLICDGTDKLVERLGSEHVQKDPSFLFILLEAPQNVPYEFLDVAGNALACAYERPIGPPKFHPFPVAFVLQGIFGACALVAGLIARKRFGTGQKIVVPLENAGVFAQTLIATQKMGIPRGFLPLQMVASPFMGVYPCKDGRFIYLHIAFPEHNRLFLELLKQKGVSEGLVESLDKAISFQTRKDPSKVRSTNEAKIIRRALKRLFSSREASWWEDNFAQKVCCVRVRSFEEWVSETLDTGDFVDIEDPKWGKMRVLGPLVSFDCNDQSSDISPLEMVKAEEVLQRWETRLNPLDTKPSEGTPPPLEGMKVLDLSRVIAGPMCSRLLAFFGAECLTIQNPSSLEWSLLFHILFGAGKKSVTLDYRSEEGMALLRRCIEEKKFDVFLQNWRSPDIAKKIGLDEQSIRKVVPQIVYVHINAFGDKGKFASYPGFEQVVQAVSGVEHCYGEGRPRLLPIAIADMGAGALAGFGALVGIYHRLQTGEGCSVRVHLTTITNLLQVRQLDKKNARNDGAKPRIVRCLDGYVLLGGTSEVQWIRMLFQKAQEVERKFGGRYFAIRVNPIKEVCLRLANHKEEALRVRKVLYDGIKKPVAFVPIPISMAKSKVGERFLTPVRGAHTEEFLKELGVEAKEGAGVIEYPKEMGRLRYAFNAIRWAWHAIREKL